MVTCKVCESLARIITDGMSSPHAARAIKDITKTYNVSEEFAQIIIGDMSGADILMRDDTIRITNIVSTLVQLNREHITNTVIKQVTELFFPTEPTEHTEPTTIVDVYHIYSEVILHELVQLNWLSDKYNRFDKRLMCIWGASADELPAYKDVYYRVHANIIAKIVMDGHVRNYNSIAMYKLVTCMSFGKNHVTDIVSAIQKINPHMRLVVTQQPIGQCRIQVAQHCPFCKQPCNTIFDCSCIGAVATTLSEWDSLYHYAHKPTMCKTCGIGYVDGLSCCVCGKNNRISRIQHARYGTINSVDSMLFHYTSTSFSDAHFLDTTTRQLSFYVTSGEQVIVEHAIISGRLVFHVDPCSFTNIMYTAHDTTGKLVKVYYLTNTTPDVDPTSTFWLAHGDLFDNEDELKKRNCEQRKYDEIIRSCRAHGMDLQPNCPITRGR